MTRRYVERALDSALGRIRGAERGCRNSVLAEEAHGVGRVAHLAEAEPAALARARRCRQGGRAYGGRGRADRQGGHGQGCGEPARPRRRQDAGPADDKTPGRVRRQRQAEAAGKLAGDEESEAERIAAARAIWNGCVPVAAGDPAFVYLTETRGLGWNEAENHGLRSIRPETARFCRNLDPRLKATRDDPNRPNKRWGPCLVFPCRNAGGEIMAVHCILLKDGGRRRGMKISRGITNGHPIHPPPSEACEALPPIVCEGPEDAFSWRIATGRGGHAAMSLNNFRNAPDLPEYLVCIDRVAGALEDELAAFRPVGRELSLLRARLGDRPVSVVFPPATAKDANDALSRHGRKALPQALEWARRVSPLGDWPDKPDASADPAGFARGAGLHGETPEAWINRLVRKDDGGIRLDSARNVKLPVENHDRLRGMLVHDAFAGRALWRSLPPWDEAGDLPRHPPRALHESDIFGLRAWLEAVDLGNGYVARLKCGKDDADAAFRHAAQANGFHPVRNYLDGLAWDGAPRIGGPDGPGWLTYYLGVDDSRYARAVGRKILIAAVRRIRRPGCKTDTMLVLEGPRGIGKSQAVAALFGADWVTDELADMGSKDAAMQLAGRWCVEVAEMASVRRSEVESIKAFLSRQVDKYRPPYGQVAIERPRECVFVATVNPLAGYLTDPTGGRRFWPIACQGIDLDSLRNDRDRIWAEAARAEAAGEPHWLVDEELEDALGIQAARREEDPWTQAVAAFLEAERHKGRFTAHEILVGIGILARDMRGHEGKRLGAIMRALGWERKQRRPGGRRNPVWYYVRPDGESGGKGLSRGSTAHGRVNHEVPLSGP